YYENQRRNLPDNVSDETVEWMQWEYSQSALLTPDDQGRIVLPGRLLKRVGLSGEVVVIGVRDHMEIWGRTDFETFENEWHDYSQRRAKARQELDERMKTPVTEPGATKG